MANVSSTEDGAITPKNGRIWSVIGAGKAKNSPIYPWRTEAAGRDMVGLTLGSV
jgi:hypothetical protein